MSEQNTEPLIIGNECPYCKETNHTGIWSERYHKFMKCHVCGDWGIIDLRAAQILGVRVNTFKFIDPNTILHVEKNVTYFIMPNGELFIKTPGGNTMLKSEWGIHVWNDLFREAAASIGLNENATIEQIQSKIKGA